MFIASLTDKFESSACSYCCAEDSAGESDCVEGVFFDEPNRRRNRFGFSVLCGGFAVENLDPSGAVAPYRSATSRGSAGSNESVLRVVSVLYPLDRVDDSVSVL